MLNKKKNYFTIILLLLLAVSCWNFCERQASAAGAAITIEPSKSSYVKGDTVYIVITVQSNVAMSGFQGYFSYDSNVLMYQTGGSVVSGNDDSFLVDDMSYEDSGTYSMKYSVKFLARKAGSTTIELQKPYAVFCQSDSSEMSVSFNSLNVLVKKKAASAGIKNSSTAKPRSTVPADEAQPSPSPEVPQDKIHEEAHHNISQTDSPVKTKAPKKSSEQYSSKNNGISSGNVSASLKKGDTILKYNTKYRVVPVENQEDIPDGFGAAQLKFDDQLVDAYVPENDTESEYALIYCSQENEEQQFYLYDKKSDTLMPYEKVKSWYRGSLENAVVKDDDSQAVTIEKQKYLLGIMVIICLLMAIGMISMYLKLKE